MDYQERVSSLDKKVEKWNCLREKVREMERELATDCYELERETYGGLTYSEYLRTLKKTYQVGNVTVQQDDYRIWGEYQVNEDVTIKVATNVYATDTIYRPTVEYKKSNRTIQEIPKKYEKEYQQLVKACSEFKVERVTEKYRQEGIMIY